MSPMRLLLMLFSVLLVVTSTFGQKRRVEDREFFEAKIRPVLVEHCYECHNSVDTAEGGVAIDHRAGLMRGGDGGPVVVHGKPDESR